MKTFSGEPTSESSFSETRSSVPQSWTARRSHDWTRIASWAVGGFRRVIALSGLLYAGLTWVGAVVAADPPQVFTWKGGNGNWSNPNHWTPAGVPGPDSVAVITAGRASVDIDVTVSGLTVTNAVLEGPRSVTVTGEASCAEAALYASGGGSMIISPGATLNLGGGWSSLWHGYRIENFGTVRVEGPTLQGVFGGHVDNHALFVFQGDGGLSRYEGARFTFTNHPGAILRKSGGAGASQLDLTSFQNDGLTEALTGTLHFVTSLVNTGTNQAAAGATILYTGHSDFKSGSVLAGPGTNRIAASLGQQAATFTGSIRADFELAEGLVQGTFTNHGTLTWSGGSFYQAGSLTIPPDGLLVLTGGSDRSLYYDYRLENYGTVRLESAALQSVFGAAVDNHGLFELAGDFSLSRFQASSFKFRNHPEGTIRKSAGTGVSTLDLTLLENQGTLDLRTGTLALSSDYEPSASSRLNLHLGGTKPGTQFGRLQVAGTAVLVGTLQVALVDNFLPVEGDTFAFLAATHRSGVFTAVRASQTPNDLFFRPEYSANAVVLEAGLGGPEISSESADIAGGQFQFTFVGGVEATYVVEASPAVGPDTNWRPVATNTFLGIPIQFLDPDQAILPSRFFRVRFVP
jgi:hypothetical protein